MGARFLSGDSNQLFLLAPDVREWLPETHLAWQVQRAVAGFELSGFVARYRADGQGAAAYHPADMLGLVMYCQCKGIRSSRAIEAATHDDVGARVLIGNQHPDHATVARFVARNAEPVKHLLVQTLVVCARAGLLTVDVIAGDGTKVRANASKAANQTLDELNLEIDRLERLLAEEVNTWFAEAARLDEEEDRMYAAPPPSNDQSGSRDDDPGARDGGGTGHGRYPSGAAAAGSADRNDNRRGDDNDGIHAGGFDRTGGADGSGGCAAGGGGRGSAFARITDMLRRRWTAQQRLIGQADRATERFDAEHQAKIDKWRRRVAEREQTWQRARTAQQARVDAWQQQAASRAAAGKNRGPDGRPPCPPDQHINVRRAADALARAQQRLNRNLAQTFPGPGGMLGGRVINTTDPGSRIMPGKQGAGFQQYRNVQVVANRQQIILAIGSHDTPNDVTALPDLLTNTRANLDAAGISDPISAAVFDSGYASHTNFTQSAPVGTLYVAVTNEGHQTGRDPGRSHRSLPQLASWQQMADRLHTPEGKAIYRERAKIIEPVFGQLFQRLGRTLNYRGDAAETELSLWAASHNLLKAFKEQTQHQPKPLNQPILAHC